MTFKLFKENKEEGLFIKACVLPCSTKEVKVPDCRDQVYTGEEIATLLSIEANNCHFDIGHSHEKLDSVYTLQNYQSKTEEIINDEKIPVGSWIKIIFSENTLLNNKISNGEITGVSSDFSINTTKPYCKGNKELPPGVNTFLYEDVEEKECVVQNYLSFVDSPCNQMPIEVMDYEEYKLNNGDDAMKLKEALKIFNKKEDKKYDIENSEDVVRIINEITEEAISAFKDEMGTIFGYIDEDIQLIQGDLQAAQASIQKVLGEEGGDPEEDPEDSGVQNSKKKKGIENSTEDPEDPEDPDEDKLDKILNSVEKIENRVKTLEEGVEEVKKKPVIKNQHIIKNLGGKDKTRRGLFNRGES